MAGTKKRIKPTTAEYREKINGKDSQSVNGLFEEFIREKEADGLVKETISAYKVSYKKLCDDFEGVDAINGGFDDESGNITVTTFTNWKIIMRNGDLREATINHHLGCIRAFMYWCMDDARKYIEPFKIRLIKIGNKRPKDYTIEEVEKLLKRPDKKAKFTEWRTWAICCFVIGTGARVGTMVEIRIKDVDLKEAKVRYEHTKNKNEQTVNIPPQLVRTLKEFIDVWRTRDTEQDDFLFCNVSGEQLSKPSLTQGYREYVKKRGVTKTNIHGLRHTFAREWYLNGGDVVMLSKILGHSSIHMSEHYMNIYADSATEKFIACNPLEKITKVRRGATKTVKRND